MQKGVFSDRHILIAATTLVGTIVGAGILGIPYTIAKAGFLYGLLILIGLGVAFIFLNLFAGEMVLRTKGHHQLTGYAEKYLGKAGKYWMTLTMFLSLYGALTAYVIGEGATLHSLLGFGSPLLYSIIFFLVASYIVYRGINTTGKTELILILLLIMVVGVIGVFSFGNIEADNLTGFDLTHAFLPYGVILFAYMALPAIPELREMLARNKRKMKRSIIVGSIIPIVLYLLFSFVVVGVVGLENFTLLEANERIATIALSLYANSILGVLANILAVLAMFTSFLTIAIALVGMYNYDYGISRKWSLLLAFSLPLVIVLFGFTSFIGVIGVTGAVAGGSEAILVMLMYWRAKKLGDRTPEYSLGNHYLLGGFLILLFLIGIGYDLFGRLF